MSVDLTGSSPLGGGLHAIGSQVLPPELLAWLRRVRGRLTFDLVVTSGVRTPEAQARAMRAKLDGYATEAEGVQALHDLYRRDDLIDEIATAGLAEDQIRATVEAQVARGDLLSSHLSGRALDLRSRGHSEGELVALDAAVRAEGGRTVRESVPPHVHVETASLTDRRARTVTGPR